MNKPESSDYVQYYLEHWSLEIGKENYETALNYAIRGYLIAKDIDDRGNSLAFLNHIKIALKEFLNDFLDEEDDLEHDEFPCSFCGIRYKDDRILLGGNGAICNVCSERVYNHFHTESK